MAFARRKPSDANPLPRRSSSLRVSSSSSARGRTPSASRNNSPPHVVPELTLCAVKDTSDKEQSHLDVITETSPKKESISRATKPANPPPVITRKKSTVSLRSNNDSNDVAAVQRRIVSGSNHPAVQETRSKQRPMSMTLIPSPSPTRTSTLHSRKDKYGALTDDSHRRSASVRSVSTNADKKSIFDSKTTDMARGIIPPRTTSQPLTQSAPTEKKLPTAGIRAVIPPRTTSQPPNTTRPDTKPEINNDEAPAETPVPSKMTLRPQKSSQEVNASLTNPKSGQKESTILDIPNPRSPVHKKQSSRELLQSLTRSNNTKPTIRPESRTASTAPSTPPRTTSHKRLPSKDNRTQDTTKSITTNGSTPPRNTVHKQQSSRDLRASSRLQSHAKQTNQQPLKAKPSRDLAPRPSRETLNKPTALRKQLSKEFSPSPSAQSSPNTKMKSSSSTVFFDSPPEQIRLLQLLHLIPLSDASLSQYETSAHKTLSTRYRALQSRFEAIQKLDYAQCLLDELTTLKTWSDGQIRTLATLLIDWESLSTDLRNFNRRLAATLKPVNKSVIEEKGSLFLRPTLMNRSSVLATSRFGGCAGDITVCGGCSWHSGR